MNLRFVAFLLAGSAIAGPASAAAPADGSDDRAADILVFGTPDNALTLPTTTGSRLGLTSLETPASVTSLDGDEIRARGDLSIVDAVTRAPGITSSANPGNGGTALAARGFSGQGSVLQLVDGIRLFPVAGTITFPTDPWNVDRIEVLSGPASVLYGQGALGGAINVLTKQPSDRTSLDAEASYGSQDTRHIAADAGGPIGEMLSYRVDASWRQSDGYVDRGRSKSIALAGALHFAPTETFSLTVRDDYGNQRPMAYFGTPLIAGVLVNANQRRNYNVADASLHYRDNRATLVANWSPSEAVVVSNAAYRLTSKRLFKDLESYFYDAGTGMIDRADNLGIVHDQTQYGDQGTAKLSTPLGGTVHNDLVVGFDVNVIDLTYSNDFGSDSQEDSVDPYRFDPGLFLDTQGIAPRFRTHTREYSLFAEDRLKLNEQISLVGGLRYESDRVRRSNIVYDINGTTSDAPVFSKQLNNTTWRVGAVYQPVRGVSIYAQYSTGVDPIGTLTTFSASQTQFKNTTGNQVEGGVKTSFLDGRGSVTLAAYRIVKK
ncbi:MAG: TonB-dependent receptor, partial [Janthinobacterium lividum]